MASYEFTFFFPQLDHERQRLEVTSWGGHLGMAFNRAWREVKKNKKYQGIKNLRPVNVSISPPKKD